MVHEIKRRTLTKKFKEFIVSPLFIPTLLLLFIVITVPVVYLVSTKPVDIRQRAAPGTPTATMNIAPPNGSYTPGQQFSVDLIIDGGGQVFNAAQADIAISSNLTINSVTIIPQGNGGCNFTYVNTNKTPTTLSPSFAGAILNGSSTNCKLITITLTANAIGTGTIALTKTAVKSYTNHQDIFLSAQNGAYTIGSIPTPTPTEAVPTVTSTPSPTPIIPTATPTPVIPTATPVVLEPPTINSLPTNTYLPSLVLSGSKTSNITQVFVNNSTSGVVYPTTTTWQLPINLIIGQNTYSVFGRDAGNTQSNTVSVNIQLHRAGDITGDNVIDLTDLSIFGSDWEKTVGFNNPLSDMDGDSLVDLTDFSILAAAYGN